MLFEAKFPQCRKTLASHWCGRRPGRRASILVRGVEICLNHSHVLSRAELGGSGLHRKDAPGTFGIPFLPFSLTQFKDDHQLCMPPCGLSCRVGSDPERVSSRWCAWFTLDKWLFYFLSSSICWISAKARSQPAQQQDRKRTDQCQWKVKPLPIFYQFWNFPCAPVDARPPWTV